MGISHIHRTVAGTILTPFGDFAISLITARDRPTLRTRLRGPSPTKNKKNKKNTALCVYIYLTEYLKKKKGTNEIRKEINKKIEKRES